MSVTDTVLAWMADEGGDDIRQAAQRVSAKVERAGYVDSLWEEVGAGMLVGLYGAAKREGREIRYIAP